MATMPSFATESAQTSLFTRGRQRDFVKVQDGCCYRCTFCIVTVARGEEQSRAIADIIEEINNLHAQGINEIILTGVHLGDYGSDLDTNLVSLIKAILNETTIAHLGLGSLEPWGFNDEFFELLRLSVLSINGITVKYTYSVSFNAEFFITYLNNKVIVILIDKKHRILDAFLTAIDNTFNVILFFS